MLNILHSVLPLCYKKEYYTFAKTSQMRFRMTYFRESLYGNGQSVKLRVWMLHSLPCR